MITSGVKKLLEIFSPNDHDLSKMSQNIAPSDENLMAEQEDNVDSLEKCGILYGRRYGLPLKSYNSYFLKNSVLRIPCTTSCKLCITGLTTDGCTVCHHLHQSNDTSINTANTVHIAEDDTVCKSPIKDCKKSCCSNNSGDDKILCFIQSARESHCASEVNELTNSSVKACIMVNPRLKSWFCFSLKRKLPIISTCSVYDNDIVHCAFRSKRRYLDFADCSTEPSVPEKSFTSKKRHVNVKDSKYPTAVGIQYVTDYASSDEEISVSDSVSLEPDKRGFYVVERILAEKIIVRKQKKAKYYYIKWVGWSHRYDTWEPESNLGHVEIVMKRFRDREEALACIVHNKEVCSNLERLRQLRNLDRWEEEINTKLNLSHQRRLYVYNDLDGQLKPEKFTYITSSILPTFMTSYITKEVTHFCKCDGEMCSKCSKCCPTLEGYTNFYTIHGHLKQTYCKDQGKIVECNNRCGCNMRCPTRVLQRGRRNLVAIARTPLCGWGVFALEKIPANRFVVEYVGEVLSPQKARKRHDPYYQFEISESGEVKYVIDAKYYGNESAFINHSCDPNLVAVPVYVERMIPGYHRIGFFALRDIERGEELTLDYFNNPLEESNYIRDEDGIKCCCGAKCCKGYFPQVLSDELSPTKNNVC